MRSADGSEGLSGGSRDALNIDERTTTDGCVRRRERWNLEDDATAFSHWFDPMAGRP